MIAESFLTLATTAMQQAKKKMAKAIFFQSEIPLG
jgi:hypothetical protein